MKFEPPANLLLRALGAALALAVPFGIHAADDTDTEKEARDEATPLPEIVVSGDKLGRTVSESSASVGVATEEDLESGTDRKMHEVVSKFGNVVRIGSDREIAIRGVPQDGIAGEGQTISVYLDGVPLTERAASFAGPSSTFDLERVEVLRGPQSTSQGRNSLGGAVMLQSKDPTEKWDAHARMAGFSRNGHQYAFAGGGPLLGDQLMFRVMAEDHFERGDVTNVTLDRNDAAREIRRTGRAKLTFAPNAWPDYRATLSATQGDNEFGDTLHDVTFGKRTESANVRYNETYDGDVYSLEQFMLLGPYLDLTSITGGIDGDGFRIADFDRTEEENGFSTFDLVEDRFTQELRLGFTFSRVHGVFGLYYEDTEDSLLNEGQGVPAGGGLVTVSGFVNSADEVETGAAFTEVDWEFLRDWRLTLGLRWNEERADREGQGEFNYTLQVPADQLPAPLDDLLADQVPGVPLPDAVSDALSEQTDQVPGDYDVSENEDFSVLLPKIGLSWAFLHPHSISLTYQEGYRSGGISVTFFGGEVSVFDPEFTKTLEVALRTRWLNDRLQANLNLFGTDWEDQQVLVGDPTGFNTTTTNAGSSQLFGLESEVLWRFARHFETFASLGLLATEFEEFVNEGQDFAGNEFPYAPDYTATVGLALLPWRNWEGQINVQHIDEFYSGPSNTPDRLVPGRTLINMRAGYRLLPGLSVFAYGRNLTDELNLQGRFASDNRVAHRYGEARTLGVGLEWKP